MVYGCLHALQFSSDSQLSSQPSITVRLRNWTIFNQVVFSKIDWSQERLSLCSNNHCHDLLVCWDHKSDMTSFAETQTTDCRGRSRAYPSESRWLACSNGSRTETSMQLTGDAYNDSKRWQKVESLEEAKILPAWTCPNIGIRSCVWMNNQTGRAFRPYQRVPWWCWFVPCLGWLDSLRGLIDLYWSFFLSLMRSSIPSLLKQHYFEHHHQRIPPSEQEPEHSSERNSNSNRDSHRASDHNCDRTITTTTTTWHAWTCWFCPPAPLLQWP